MSKIFSGRLRGEVIEPFIFSVLIFLATYPYFIWKYFNLVPYIYIFIAVVACRNFRKLPFQHCAIFCMLIVAYLMLSFHRGTHLVGTTINLSLAIIPFVRQGFIRQSYCYFRWILVVIFFVSIVSFISVAFGLQSPKGILEPINDIKQYVYVQYRFLVIPSYREDLGRFCSVFDEPGVVGTIAALIILVERFNFKRKSNIIILLAGLLSFSLFFYLIVGVYGFYRSSYRNKIGLIIAVGVFFIVTQENEFIKVFLWDRLTFTDGHLVGNNRNSAELLSLWRNSINNPKILVGFGSEYVKNHTESASIQFFILRDGFLFVICYLVSYLLYAFVQIGSIKECLLFTLIMLATLYQRPGFCNAEYSFLFVSYIINRDVRSIGINSYY